MATKEVAEVGAKGTRRDCCLLSSAECLGLPAAFPSVSRKLQRLSIHAHVGWQHKVCDGAKAELSSLCRLRKKQRWYNKGFVSLKSDKPKELSYQVCLVTDS